MFKNKPLVLITPEDADPAFQEILLHFRDKGFDCELKTSEAYLETLTDQLPLGIFHTDVSARIDYVNKPCEQMSGYTGSELIGDKWFTIIHPADKLRIQEEIANLIQHPQLYATSANLINNEGVEVCVYMVFSPYWDKKETDKLLGFWGVFFNVGEYFRQHHLLERTLEHDPLTRLPNRISFEKALSEKIAQAKRHETKMALIEVDINDFTTLNELYAHRINDVYLKHIGFELKKMLRQVDFVARIGADEFAIILDNISDIPSLSPVIERIQSIFSAPFAIEKYVLSTTVSMGISIYPDIATNTDGLDRAAHRALEHAKISGKPNVQFEDLTLNKRLDRNLVIRQELQTAIETNELTILYQPQINTLTEKLSGYEALLRWDNKILGSVSPVEFVLVAEQSGLISKIGKWVFEQALAQHAKWMNEHYKTMGHVKLSVNLSPDQLHDDNILEWVSEHIVKHGLQPQQIVIELTETAIMSDVDHNIKVIQGLRSLGIGVAMDDFGTGYSSLTFLGKLPITQLKIDKSFIHTIDQSGKDAAIVKAVILLSDALGIEVIAEGVETEEQLKYLRDNTCNTIQGYYYAKPLTPAEMAVFIAGHT